MESLKKLLADIDNLLKTYVMKLIRANEESVRRDNEKYVPFLLKWYKKFHPNEKLDADDLTAPLPEKIYKLIYVKKFTKKECFLFANILARYLHSGQPSELALLDLGRLRSLKPYKRTVLLKIHKEVTTNGKTIYDSIQSLAPELFDKGLLSALKIGESSNKQEECMNNYIEDVKFELENGKKVKRSLGYPIFLGIMLVGVCIGASLTIIPDLETSLEQTNIAGFGMVKGVAKAFTNYLYITLWISLLLLFKYTKSHSPSFKLLIDFLLLNFSITKAYLTAKDLRMFFRSMYSQLSAGISDHTAHMTSINYISNTAIKSLFTELDSSIKDGLSISEAYSTLTFIDEDIKALLRVSESSGDLVSTMKQVSETQTERLKDITETLTANIPSVTMVIAGIAIMAIFVPMMYAMYNFDQFIN